MKKISYIFILLYFVISTPFTMASQNLTINLPLEEVKLNTGHKVWVSKNKDTELMSLSLIFNQAGNYFDPKDKAGLADFTSTMLEEGVQGYDKNEIAKFKEKYGITLIVRSDNTQITVHLVTPTANIEKAIELLDLTLNHPTFPKDRVRKVQDQLMIQYKNLLNEPNYYTRLQAMDYFFSNTVLANIPSEKTISNITRSDLVNCLKNSFTSQNIIIGLAGNFTTDLLTQYLPMIIEKLPKGFNKKELDPIQANSDQRLVFEDNTQFQTGIIQFYSKSLPINFDYKTKVKLLNHIFGGKGFSTRLMDSLRVKRGLVYGAYTSQAYNDVEHSINSTISIDFGKLEEGLKVTKDEIINFYKLGIEEKELNIAKNILISRSSLLFETDSNTSVVLAELQKDLSNINEVKNLNNRIKNISRKELNEIIKEWFKPENFYFYILGDKSQIHDKSIVN